MLRIHTKRHREETVSYSLVYEWLDMPGAGFGFACDAEGNIDTSKAEPDCTWPENYRKCVSGEYAVRFMGIREYRHAYTHPAVGTCECGREVVLDGDTRGEGIDCECGRIYNALGQELAPRSQWEPDDPYYDSEW